MKKQLYWIFLLPFIFTGMQYPHKAQAEATLLMLPEDAKHRITTPDHIYTKKGTWERATGHFLGPLPIPQHTDILIASPWILGLSDYTVYQVENGKLKRILEPYHPHQSIYETRQYPQTHSQWLATLSYVPTLKHLSATGSVLGSWAFSGYTEYTTLKGQDETLEVWEHDTLRAILDANTLQPHSQELAKREDHQHFSYSTHPSFDTLPSPHFSAGALNSPFTISPFPGTYQWGVAQIFRIYDLHTGQLHTEFEMPGGPISGWSLYEHQLFIARQNILQPNLEIWDWQKQQQVRRFQGTHSPTQYLGVIKDDLISESSDDLCAWNRHTGALKTCTPLRPGEAVWFYEEQEGDIVFHLYPQNKKASHSRQMRLSKDIFTTSLEANPLLEQNEWSTISEDNIWYQNNTQRLLYSVGGHYAVWDMQQNSRWTLDPCQYWRNVEEGCSAQVKDWDDQEIIFALGTQTLRVGMAGVDFNRPQTAPQKYLVIHAITGQMEFNQPGTSAIGDHPRTCFTPDYWWIEDDFSGEKRQQGYQYIHRPTGARLEARLSPEEQITAAHCLNNNILLRIQSPTRDQWKWVNTDLASSKLPPLLNFPLLGLSTSTAIFQAAQDFPYFISEPLGKASQTWDLPENPVVPIKCKQHQQRIYCLAHTQEMPSTYVLDLNRIPLRWEFYLDTPQTPKGMALLSNSNSPFLIFYYGGKAKHQILLYMSKERIPLWITDQGYHWSTQKLNIMPYFVHGDTATELPPTLYNPLEVKRALQGLPPLHPSGTHLDLQALVSAYAPQN